MREMEEDPSLTPAGKHLMRYLFDSGTLDSKDSAFLMEHAVIDVPMDKLVELCETKAGFKDRWTKPSSEMLKIGTQWNDRLVDSIEARFSMVPMVSHKHQNITFREMHKALAKEIRPTVYLALMTVLLNSKCMVDASAACLTLAAAASQYPESIMELLIRTRVLALEDEGDQIKMLGEAHTIVRSTSTWFGGRQLSNDEVRQLQYIKELMSRRVYDENIWFDDIGQRLRAGPIKRFYTRNRLTGRLEGSEQVFHDKLRFHIRDQLRKCLPEFSTRVNTIEEFWEQRHVWVASGAAPRYKVLVPVRKYNQVTGEVENHWQKVRVNKRAAFEQLTLQQLREEWADEPYLYSVGSLKHENGKLRTLYNTQLSHYVAQAYILEALEPCFGAMEGYDLNYVDRQALDGLRQRTATAIRGQPMWMWDYTDFNVQHENEDMSVIWRELKALLSEVECDNPGKQQACEEMKAMCDWVAAAEHNALMISPDGKIKGIKKRGLLTGSRATQSTNTILNIAYMQILKEQYLEIFKVQPIIYSYNHGDDVFAEVMNRTDAVMLTHVARCIGLAGNVNKIARDFGEYLRIRYDEDGVGGHVLRSIANIVTRDWQASSDFLPEEKVVAMTVQMRKAVARGANAGIMQQLHKHELDFYRTFQTEVKWIENREWRKEKMRIKVPSLYFSGSVLNNLAGAGTVTEAPIDLGIRLPKKRIEVSIPKFIRQYYGSEMSDDFWKKAHRLFPMMSEMQYFELAQIKHTMQADNIMGSLPGYVLAIMKRRYAQELTKYCAKLNRALRNSQVEHGLAVSCPEIAMHALLDLEEMTTHWLDCGYNLWNYDLNPLLAMERSVAKLPSKRKDLLRLWATAYSRHFGTTLYNGLVQVGAITSSKGELSSWLTGATSVMSEELACKAALGLIPFDNCLGGTLATEIEQLIRNNAIWHACLLMLSKQRLLTNKTALQRLVRDYELTIVTLLNGEFRNFRDKYWRP